MSWRRMTQPKLIDRDDIVILKRVNFSVLDEDFDGKIHFFSSLDKDVIVRTSLSPSSSKLMMNRRKSLENPGEKYVRWTNEQKKKNRKNRISREQTKRDKRKGNNLPRV